MIMATTNVKVTKAERFNTLMALVETSDIEDKDGMMSFLQGQLDQIAAKAEKAKDRAAEKKAAGDELRAAVQSVLTDELQTAEQILAQIDGEDLTKAKIVARLTQLVKSEIATKEQIKNDEGKACMAYKLLAD